MPNMLVPKYATLLVGNTPGSWMTDSDRLLAEWMRNSMAAGVPADWKAAIWTNLKPVRVKASRKQESAYQADSK
jgi:hypothetical protein